MMNALSARSVETRQVGLIEKSLTASSLPLTSNEEITTSLGFLTEKFMSEPMLNLLCRALRAL